MFCDYYIWGRKLLLTLKYCNKICFKIIYLILCRIVVGEGEEFGHEKDRAYLLDDSVLTLPLEPLKHVSLRFIF